MLIPHGGQSACVAYCIDCEGALMAAHGDTPQEPIAIMPAPGASPFIRHTTADTLFDITADASRNALGYWLIDGFEIDMQQHDGAGFRVEGFDGVPASHVVIRNNRVHNGKGGHGVLIAKTATDVLVEGNHIFDQH